MSDVKFGGIAVAILLNAHSHKGNEVTELSCRYSILKWFFAAVALISSTAFAEPSATVGEMFEVTGKPASGIEYRLMIEKTDRKACPYQVWDFHAGAASASWKAYSVGPMIMIGFGGDKAPGVLALSLLGDRAVLGQSTGFKLSYRHLTADQQIAFKEKALVHEKEAQKPSLDFAVKLVGPSPGTAVISSQGTNFQSVEFNYDKPYVVMATEPGKPDTRAAQVQKVNVAYGVGPSGPYLLGVTTTDKATGLAHEVDLHSISNLNYQPSGSEGPELSFKVKEHGLQQSFAIHPTVGRVDIAGRGGRLKRQTSSILKVAPKAIDLRSALAEEGADRLAQARAIFRQGTSN